MQSAGNFQIIPFVASLVICAFACNSPAGTPEIRISVVQGKAADSGSARLASALSHEFSKFDGISVTDNEPMLIFYCNVFQSTLIIFPVFSASIAVTDRDGHFIMHQVHVEKSIQALAHAAATNLNAVVIEPMRRTAQPSSSP